MATSLDTHKFARQFQKVYPSELHDRLKWWSRVLGIDRKRFAMMMGVPKGDASGRWNWKSITDQYREKAWQVDEALSQALSSYDYDWHAFASGLHGHARTAGREKSGVRVPQIAKIPQVAKIPLNELARGGPPALPRFVASLSRLKIKNG